VSHSYFISDLHLHAARPAVTRALADFLASHRDCDALYILGDLFEAWIGDDDDSAIADEVTGLLRAFSAAGPTLYLMQGNRDFLLGEAFAAATGATIMADPTVIDLYGTATLLLHGDSLCTGDTEYMAFRQQARDPAWQAQLLAQSLGQRRELARNLRAMSAETNSNKAEDIMDVTPAEVVREMERAGVRQMIHGHTHRPARHDEPSGVRWVLGDWDESGWFIEASPAGLKLKSFSI
jgi:UDP-2,3-diacylglucosamine hydrolase